MNALHWSTQVLEVIVALLLAPLFVGWINQCRAWLQNRSAPSVLQPYRGIRKLFHKDAVVATNASPLFRVAPYVVFGTMACAAAIMADPDRPYSSSDGSKPRTAAAMAAATPASRAARL